MPNSNWARYQRYKHIKRKKSIVKNVYHIDNYYDCNGKYDGAKIHCSCGMCMAKTRNKGYRRRHIHGNYAPSINYKISELRRQQAMDADEQDYFFS